MTLSIMTHSITTLNIRKTIFSIVTLRITLRITTLTMTNST
jgi:hypothetical protein